MSFALVTRSALAGALALLAAPLALRAQPAPARVFGVEIERGDDVDRLLVLAQGDSQATLEEPAPDRVVLRLTNATLDPSAARRVVSGTSAVIRGVVVEASEGPPPVVVIRASRTPGLRAAITRRGAIVALEVAHPAESRVGAQGSVLLNLRDRPLVDLVREVQRITQKRFVWDDRLQGNVTVIVQDPITPGEALELLHSTLVSKGFAAVPAPDDTFVVLPLDEAGTRAPRRDESALRAERAGLVTVLTRFRSADAVQLVNLLSPYAGGTLRVVPYAPTNGAILVGPENGIHHWLELARALDETTGSELAVLRPRHRTAAELVDLLGESLRDPLTGRARAELFLDERSNALVLRADPTQLARVREQLATLDVAPSDEGEVLVIHPRFADPDELLAQLQQLASQTAAPSAPLGSVPTMVPGGFAPSLPPVGLAPEPTRGLGPFHVALHKSTRSLLVTGDAATRNALRDLVDRLDVEPALISIEANVLEISTTGTLALGIDAFLPSTDPANPGRTIFGVGVGDPFDLQPDPVDPTFLARYARTPVVVPVIGPGGFPINVTLPRDIVQLKAAGGTARVRSLLQPRLVALSGEKHEFSAGLNVPVRSAATPSAQGATSNPLQTRVNVERQEVGLRLRLTPVAGAEGAVRVGVDLEVTALQPASASTRTDIGPEIAKRALQATTQLEDGQASVLGMLLERSNGSTETGPPVLKDVPVLGNLLRQSSDSDVSRTLVITLQAHILRSSDERLADTIRVRTAHERALARSGALATRGAWALRIGTRPTREAAEAAAAAVGAVAGRDAHVEAWRWADVERFDIVVAGFKDVREAAAALPELAERGWDAELVPVPKRER